MVWGPCISHRGLGALPLQVVEGRRKRTQGVCLPTARGERKRGVWVCVVCMGVCMCGLCGVYGCVVCAVCMGVCMCGKFSVYGWVCGCVGVCVHVCVCV